MKTYKIFIAKDEVFGEATGYHRAYVLIGEYSAKLSSYKTPRAARKAAKDFIKQIKEAEPIKEIKGKA